MVYFVVKTSLREEITVEDTADFLIEDGFLLLYKITREGGFDTRTFIRAFRLDEVIEFERVEE